MYYSSNTVLEAEARYDLLCGICPGRGRADLSADPAVHPARRGGGAHSKRRRAPLAAGAFRAAGREPEHGAEGLSPAGGNGAGLLAHGREELYGAE